MALKSNKTVHQEKSKLLLKMRKDAGLTQQDLSIRLQISREKVVAIENCHLQQMESITSDLEDRWWKVCRSRASQNTKESWMQFILNKLNI